MPFCVIRPSFHYGLCALMIEKKANLSLETITTHQVYTYILFYPKRRTKNAKAITTEITQNRDSC